MENENKKNTGRIIILIIIGILLIIGTSVLTISILNKRNSNSINGANTLKHNYTKEEIRNMYADKTKGYDVNGYPDSYMEKFNELLNYIDKIAGEEKYLIDTMYTTNSSYVIKIVLKEYVDKYNSWTGKEAQNPYKIMFTRKYNEPLFDNYYYTFILGVQYEKEIINELTNINSQYEYIMDYNTLLYISSSILNAYKLTTWEEALDHYSVWDSKSNLPTIYIVSDSSKSIDELKTFVNNNIDVFKKYYVQYVTVIQLKENETITDYDNFNKYTKIVNSYDVVKIIE